MDVTISDREINTIHNKINDWRPQITSFWNFPQIKNGIKIDSAKKIVNIDNRKFSFPILIELNEKLETTLKFDSNHPSGHKKLTDHVLSLKPATSFVLIDTCKNARDLGIELGDDGFCMVIGYGNHYNYQKPISGKERIPFDDLCFLMSLPPHFRAHRVAHAGGEIEGHTYTNSLEALNKNFKKGYLFFEIDFSFTKDEKLVCIHDWNKSFNKIFGFKCKEKPTYEAFKELVEKKSELNICTLESLRDWLIEHPTTYLITDVKGDNLKALKIIADTIPDFRNRVIPQIYKPENYNKVKEIGFEKIIWTLYRYHGSAADILSWAKKIDGQFAITMNKYWAKTDLPSRLQKRKIPTYVHTVNKKEEMDKYFQNSITEIYTDYLAP